MPKNVNCAAMGFDCNFSLTSDDEDQQFMLKTVENHAASKHPELLEEEKLKPAVRSKLEELLAQSHYSPSSS